MSRKQPKRRAGRLASAAIAGFFIVAIACGVGFSVASADSSDDLARAGAFGFDEATHVATIAAAAGDAGSEVAEVGTSGRFALVSPATRDIEAGLAMLDEREAVEQERVEVENAAAVKRVESKKAMQGVAAKSARSSASGKNVINNVEQVDNAQTIDELDEYDLPAVDWSCGKKAFVDEWTARIDDYLEGTPLEGYGSVFAESAWENGVDPRWSPAISNTESGNGAHCFLPYNAWGWGEDAWSDWETAIRAHVAGLADCYGYSVTFEAAQKYCPPNCVHWYNNTTSQMALI